MGVMFDHSAPASIAEKPRSSWVMKISVCLEKVYAAGILIFSTATTRVP